MTRVKQILVAAAAGLALTAAPVLAQQAQTKQQQSGSRPAAGRPSSGTAVARPSGGGSSGAASAPRPAGPSGVRSGSSRPAGSASASGGSRGVRAVPRSGPAPSRAVSGSRQPNGARSAREVPQYSRPRGNRVAVGSATERGPRPPGGGWYPGYPGYPSYPSYPWYGYPGWNWGWGYGYPYYGGFGVGFFSYAPYSWGGYYGGGYATSGQYTDTGKLRLKVKPRDAQVFVDGYYMGVVDEFDGTFQRLRLETGGHRVEIRLDGYQPLTFDVLIPLGETITYRGELRRQ